MSEITSDTLISIARQYYPSGFPVERDDYSQPLLAHQRTPEHEQWRAAWRKALAWEKWDHLLNTLEDTFPSEDASDATQPWHSACRRCCIYITNPLADGRQTLFRVAVAASILAPLYATYVTTRILKPGVRPSPPQMTFEPPHEVTPQVALLSQLVERELGYRPFPMEFSGIVIPDLRVDFRNSMEPPTLLEALFSDHLENLP